ncbi:hypothetical protein PS726_00169 [Pseudomonas fluorescens]|uniref:phage tail tape measure protein n=1 Tax=Pseudomonas fluorescens TaxID=294 RepID=UPI001241DCD3|nr:phage tail tape measure protein [Pseudomonas fluorescens]VVN67163.1 hypothetical protein PS726_00169 [Pseudomonas fluorescens]
MSNSMRLNLIMGLVDKITGPILKVTDTTSRMGEKIKATQSELSRLGNTSKDIEHFKALEARTGQTAQALALAQSKAQALGQQLNATANPTRKMTDEFTRAAEQVKRLQAQQQSERLELQRTGQQLSATGVNTGRLSEATRLIEMRTRRYNEQLAKEQKALALVAEKQKRLGEIKQRNSDMKMSATGDAIGVGVAIAGAKQLVDAYGEVVTARNDGLALGLDQAGIDSITAKAKEFSNMWSGTTQKEFIEGAVEIKSAIDTLGADAIGDFTKIAALVAKSTKSTTAEMTSLMSTGYGVYRRQFDDFGKAVVAGWDKMSAEERDIEFGKYFAAGLVETVNVFKSDGQQMSAALTNLGATATSANIPFAEQLAILGQLQLTMSGSEAATKYRSFIGAAAGASEKLGVSFMDANDKLLSMPAILEVLRDKYGDTLDAMETQEMKKAFGTDEAIALIQLLYPEIDSLKKNISGMGEALKTGMSTTERMAQIMNSGPNESFKLMSQRIQNASVTLGAVFAPAMMFAAGAVGQLASLIGSLAERFPFLSQVIGFALVGLVGLKVASIAARFGFAFLSDGLMLARRSLMFFTAANLRTQAALLVTRVRAIAAATGVFLLGTASRAFAVGAAVMTAAQWALNVAMSANPIGLVIAGMLALVVVVALVVRYWEPLKGFFGGLWDGIKVVFSAGWEFIKALFNWSPVGLVAAVWQPLAWLFTTLWDGIKVVFSAGWEFIKSLFTWSPLGMVTAAWEPLTGFFTTLWAGIKSSCGSAMEWIAQKTMAPITAIKDFAGGLFGSDSPVAAAGPSSAVGGAPPGASAVGGPRVPAAAPVGMVASPAGMAAAPQQVSQYGDIVVQTQPGMSEEAVAKKVRAELDARDRQASRSQRGRLGDGQG